MKLFTSLSLFLVFVGTMGTAQSIKKEQTSYTMVRLPLKPLDANMAGYSFSVSTPYPENNDDLERYAKEKFEADQANYPALVEESKLLHQQALDQYDQDVITARENFKIESDEFSKMSFVERMAMADQKPKLKLPSKPVYRKPSEPRYQKPNLSRTIVFNPEVLASTYLRVDGYDPGENNALTGSVVFYDFEAMDPTTEVREESYYDTRAKATRKKSTTFYKTKYKRPTELLLEYNGEVLHTGIFEDTGEFIEEETTARLNMFNKEKQSIEDNLKRINDYINIHYGYTPITMPVTIRYVKNKKGLYDDLEDAKDLATAGYGEFDPDGENEDLLEAIDLWKAAMKESNLDDKKARIDKKVTEAILFNLVESHIALKDVEQATDYLKQLKKMRLSYSEKQAVESYEQQLADIKIRLEANGM